MKLLKTILITGSFAFFQTSCTESLEKMAEDKLAENAIANDEEQGEELDDFYNALNLSEDVDASDNPVTDDSQEVAAEEAADEKSRREVVKEEVLALLSDEAKGVHEGVKSKLGAIDEEIQGICDKKPKIFDSVREQLNDIRDSDKSKKEKFLAAKDLFDSLKSEMREARSLHRECVKENKEALRPIVKQKRDIIDVCLLHPKPKKVPPKVIIKRALKKFKHKGDEKKHRENPKLSAEEIAEVLEEKLLSDDCTAAYVDDEVGEEDSSEEDGSEEDGSEEDGSEEDGSEEDVSTDV